MSRSTKDDGADQLLTREGSLETPDIEAKSEFYGAVDDLYSKRYTALQGEHMAAAKAAAQRAYDTLRYSEDWHVEDRTDPKRAAIDARTVLRFASSLFPAVYMLTVAKCFGVYQGRLEQDTDEARAERERYERLSASVDVDAYAAESVRRTAEQWLQYGGLNRAKEVAGEIMGLVDDHVVASAFSSLVDEVPINASHEEWNEAFRQRVPEQSDAGFRFFYVTFVDQKADDLLNHLKPAELPFKKLRAWAGITWIEGRVPGEDRSFSYGLPDVGLYGRTVPALSMQAVQAIDRAARALATWDVTIDDGPAFLDPNSGHRVTYQRVGLPLAAAQAAVSSMSARTADVWRWTTALIFANWDEGASEPRPVWIDAREMCDALGYEKHKHGGHRPENIAVVETALRDLTQFRVELTLGAKVYPRDPATGKRTAGRVIERTLSEVLVVTGTDEVRFAVDGERLPLRWEVTPGGWIRDFPPSQFAPLFRSLVELPGRKESDRWAKALGMELVWQYRQDGGRTKVQRVRTMLKQAGVLDAARRASSKRLVRVRFDKAMDIVENLGVCAFWDYNEDDLAKVAFTAEKGFSKNGFESWLNARMKAVPPPEIEAAKKKWARAD